ncbi:MAG TPA: MFS transporter [Steroidobacteraceae bacterium]|nr:MFS transporter [Steroidobacteraceae bacterium]
MSTDAWTSAHRRVVTAAFLGWMLDAFDFFLVIFVLAHIAHDFRTDVKSVTYAIFLTLAMRPLGAFLFGRLADRYGRRPALIANVLAYSAMEFASALAPSLAVFLAMRALFGVAMGGAWGVGASLALETVPVPARGRVSGILQCGYPSGYLLAAVVFGLLYGQIGWRGMLMVGALPAVLTLFILATVPESPVWAAERRGASSGNARAPGLLTSLSGHWGLVLYTIVLMTAMNFFSHGTQDLYPTFLEAQRGLSNAAESRIAIIYNIGAICGGLFFGTLSSRIGRRRTITIAVLLALPALPFWAYSTGATSLAVAAFAMQFMVQGAWGVVPVHLNELSPHALRATFPGLVYQLGNLLASYNATLQASLADSHGGAGHPDYAFALAVVCGVAIPSIALLAGLGPQRQNVRFVER